MILVIMLDLLMVTRCRLERDWAPILVTEAAPGWVAGNMGRGTMMIGMMIVVMILVMIGMMTMALGRTKHWWEYMDVFGGQGIRVMVVIEKNGCWCLPIGVEGSSGECEGIESITIKIFADISGQATIGEELGDEKLTITSYQALFDAYMPLIMMIKGFYERKTSVSVRCETIDGWSG